MLSRPAGATHYAAERGEARRFGVWAALGVGAAAAGLSAAWLRAARRRLAERVDRPELLDAPDPDPVALAGNLADLERLNRWLGGAALTARALERLLGRPAPGQAARLLDVGTGAADIPRALASRAGRHGARWQVVAVDRGPAVIRFAAASRDGRVVFAVADGLRLPFPDGAFDVALCSLVLHHLSPGDAVALLREMRRVSRRGVVVNDLVRSTPTWLGAVALSRALTRNPLTRHDSVVSARRAYTEAEIRALVAEAGLRQIALERALGYRVALAAEGA